VFSSITECQTQTLTNIDYQFEVITVVEICLYCKPSSNYMRFSNQLRDVKGLVFVLKV